MMQTLPFLFLSLCYLATEAAEYAIRLDDPAIPDLTVVTKGKRDRQWLKSIDVTVNDTVVTVQFQHDGSPVRLRSSEGDNCRIIYKGNGEVKRVNCNKGKNNSLRDKKKVEDSDSLEDSTSDPDGANSDDRRLQQVNYCSDCESTEFWSIAVCNGGGKFFCVGLGFLLTPVLPFALAIGVLCDISKFALCDELLEDGISTCFDDCACYWYERGCVDNTCVDDLARECCSYEKECPDSILDERPCVLETECCDYEQTCGSECYDVEPFHVCCGDDYYDPRDPSFFCCNGMNLVENQCCPDQEDCGNVCYNKLPGYTCCGSLYYDPSQLFGCDCDTDSAYTTTMCCSDVPNYCGPNPGDCVTGCCPDQKDCAGNCYGELPGHRCCGSLYYDTSQLHGCDCDTDQAYATTTCCSDIPNYCGPNPGDCVTGCCPKADGSSGECDDGTCASDYDDGECPGFDCTAANEVSPVPESCGIPEGATYGPQSGTFQFSVSFHCVEKNDGSQLTVLGAASCCDIPDITSCYKLDTVYCNLELGAQCRLLYCDWEPAPGGQCAFVGWD